MSCIRAFLGGELASKHSSYSYVTKGHTDTSILSEVVMQCMECVVLCRAGIELLGKKKKLLSFHLAD